MPSQLNCFMAANCTLGSELNFVDCKELSVVSFGQALVKFDGGVTSLDYFKVKDVEKRGADAKAFAKTCSGKLTKDFNE